MPIRIDLLAEDYEAEELRRKDPVKRAVLASTVIVSLMVFYCGMKQIHLMRLGSDYETQKSHLAMLTEEYELGKDQLTESRAVEFKLDALYTYSSERFLWGKVLDSIQHYGVEGISLTELRGEQAFENVPEKKQGKVTVPGSTVEKTTLWINAVDSSREAGEKVHPFRESIHALPFFSENLKEVDGIKLTDLKPPQTDPNNPDRLMVQFTIQCNYMEKDRQALQ